MTYLMLGIVYLFVVKAQFILYIIEMHAAMVLCFLIHKSFT